MNSSRSIFFNIVIALFITAFVAVPTAFAQRGEKTIGIQAGYNSHNESGLAGISFSYRFSSHFRLAPNVQYIFRNEHTDAFMFNCDFQIPVSLTRCFEIYPLAGGCYVSCNMHEFGHAISHTDDVSSRVNHFGINLGGGLGIRCTSTLRLNLEVRYSIVKNYNTTMASVGIGYCF